LRRRALDSSVDRVPLGDDDPDDGTSQLARRWVRFGLGQLALEDRRGGPLPELGFEHGRQGHASPGAL
jgi:hypothetical protein